MSNEYFGDRLIKKSRKEHRCDCCHSTIPVGNSYIYATGLYEGDFFTCKMHPQCHTIYKKAYRLADDVLAFDDTYEGIGHWGDIDDFALMKEIPNPSFYLVDMIDELGQTLWDKNYQNEVTVYNSNWVSRALESIGRPMRSDLHLGEPYGSPMRVSAVSSARPELITNQHVHINQNITSNDLIASLSESVYTETLRRMGLGRGNLQ